MYLLKAIVIIPLLLATGGIASRAVLPEKDLATLTVEEATEAANSTPLEGHKLTKAAIHAKRFDLIAVYMEGRDTHGWIISDVEEMPESTVKDRLVVMMLRSSLDDFWPWERPRLPAGSQPIASSPQDEPFRSVIERLLPGRSLPFDVLNTKASRLKLALELERAVKPDPAEAKPAKPAASPSDEPTPAATAERPAENALPSAFDFSKESTPHTAPRSSRIWLAVGGIVVALTAFTVWKRREKSGKRGVS